MSFENKDMERAVAMMVDRLVELQGADLLPEEGAVLKNFTRSFLGRGGRSPTLAVAYLDMGLAMVLVATTVFNSEGGTEVSDSIYASLRAKLAKYEALSKAEGRQ